MTALPFPKALTPFARRLLWGLLAFAALLAALHVITRQPAAGAFARRLFDMGQTSALGSGFTIVQMLALALVAGAIALHATGAGWRGRLYWGLLAGVFVFQVADEYFSFYQSVVVPGLGDARAVSLYLLSELALLFFVVTAGRGWLKDEAGPLAVILVGLLVTGLGDPLLDNLDVYLWCRPAWGKLFDALNGALGTAWGQPALCNQFIPLEEFSEIAGGSIVLAAFVAYAQRRLDRDLWRRGRIAVAGLCAVFAAWYVAHLWLFPTLEYRLLAQPAEATYLEGELSLAGYRVSRDVTGPGERLTARFYWQAHAPLDEEYLFSAHLVSRPDGELVAQADMPLGGGWTGWSTRTWPRGVVMRDTATLRLPEDLATPGSYWLVLRVWHTEGHPRRIDLSEIETLPVTHTGLQMLEADTVVVFSVPAPGDGPDATAPVASDYAFADGFRLAGYALPETASAGEAAHLAFWWETSEDVQVDLMQFIHFVNVDSGELFGFDQPPFGGRFPTEDWPGGVTVMDEVEISLPEEMPPGEYRVQTGTYVFETGERRAVSDGAGQPLPDYAIPLGTVTVEP